jgi:hypothetical protein
MAVYLATVTFEVVAEGETLDEAFRDAIDGVRQGRGWAVYVDAKDQKTEVSPAAPVSATPTNHAGAQ